MGARKNDTPAKPSDGRPPAGRPHGKRYPWAEILRLALAAPTPFVRGVDFVGEPLGFAHTLRQAAERAGFSPATGYRVSTRIRLGTVIAHLVKTSAKA